jgi:hypothetical protein
MTETQGFPQLVVTRKTGAEQFRRDGQPLGLKLIEFWQWSTSDLASNATRGILAEYIVAMALGVADGTRAEWSGFDLLTRSGVRIEVKSAAYLQSWFHKKLSNISFGIRPMRKWDPETNELSAEVKRQADI